MILNNYYIIVLIQIIIFLNIFMFFKISSIIHFLFLAILFLINFYFILSIFELDIIAGFLLCVELTGFFVILLYCLFNNLKFSLKLNKIIYLFFFFFVFFFKISLNNNFFINQYILTSIDFLSISSFFFISEFYFFFFYFISSMHYIFVFYFFLIFIVSLSYIFIINIKSTNKIRVTSEHDINRQIIRIGGIKKVNNKYVDATKNIKYNTIRLR